MPTNKNAIVRYKYIDKMLADRYHYYDIHDIVDLCNQKLQADGFSKVSQRTIEKDIAELEFAPFNAEIERYRINGKRCIRYKEPTFSIFVSKLTNDEKNLLSEVLSTIDQFEGLNTFEWLNEFKHRLNVQKHRKIISFSHNPYLKNSNLIGTIFSAISNRQVLKIHYRSFQSTDVKEITIYPYLLKQFNNRWYLIATAEDNFILNFALDRIDKIETLPDKKYKDINIDLEERFEDIVGVTIPLDATVENILLWINDEGYPYIDTKPMHASQTTIKDDTKLIKQYPTLTNGKFISLSCIINYELLQLLMMYIKDIVVLEPKHLQKKILEIIKEKNEKYFSLRK